MLESKIAALPKSAVVAGCAIVVSVTASCRMEELTPAGANVPTSTADPVAAGHSRGSCQHLGYLVGKGGGAYGTYIANDDLIQLAMNDLRNQAAELGANYLQTDPPQLGSLGGDSGTSTATITGNAYRCDSSADAESADPSAVPLRQSAPAPAREPRRSPPEDGPQGVAGFTFDMSTEAAEARCTEPGLEWSQVGADVFQCSNQPVRTGIGREVLLQFKNGTLAVVKLQTTPDDPKTIVEAYTTIRRRLEGKYGDGTIRANVPDRCEKDVFGCLTRGEASHRETWKWDDGRRIVAWVGEGRDGGSPVIRVTYRGPNAAEEQPAGDEGL